MEIAKTFRKKGTNCPKSGADGRKGKEKEIYWPNFSPEGGPSAKSVKKGGLVRVDRGKNTPVLVETFEENDKAEDGGYTKADGNGKRGFKININ